MKEELPIATQIAILAIQLGVIIFAAKFCGKLAQKIKIPPVLGELVAGIIVGPYLLGGIGLGIHGFEGGLFSTPGSGALPVTTLLYGLATLGSIILLFMSGLETDLRMFFRYSVAGTLVGLGGVIFSFLFGEVLGIVSLHAGPMDPRCLFLGILSTATSVGITARILSEKKSIDSPEGTTILAAAVIDDVLGIICLAIVMGIVGVSTAGKSGSVNWIHIGEIAVKSFGIWLAVTAIGLVLARHIARFLKSAGSFAMLALALALLLAGFFEEVGLAMIVGAYVMGLCLSKTDIAFSIQRQLRGIYDFLVPVFFVVMGMLVDVRVMGNWDVLKFGLIFSLLAVLAKIIGCALPAFFMNFNFLGSLRIGTGMIPRGEVALIIAGIGATTMMTLNGQRVPIIDSKLFGVAIIMTLITTIVAPPLLAVMLAIKGSGVRKQVADAGTFHTVYEFNSEVVRDFVLRSFIENIRHDGFLHSELDKTGGITHFRREADTFTMTVSAGGLNFESASKDIPLIKTCMYETFVEIHDNLAKLKLLSLPGALDAAVAPGANADANAAALARQAAFEVDPAKIIPPECVVTELKGSTSSEAIAELIGTLGKAGKLINANLCLRDLMDRESVASTCISGGIALPHAKTDGVNDLVAAVGVSRSGCSDPYALSKEPVRIYILTLCPKQIPQPYLRFVALIASLLMDKATVQAILDAKTPEELRSIFLRKKGKTA